MLNGYPDNLAIHSIMLIEDDIITNFLTERIIKKTGFKGDIIVRTNGQDALNYLEHQKDLNIKYARASKNRYRTYDTSLMYVTNRYSFKIYHKGTEFRYHDLKQLSKKNPIGFHLPEMCEIADRVLRYELTVRKSYLNYIMKQYFFESKTAVNYHEYRTHPLAKFGVVLASERESLKSFHGKHETLLEEYLTGSKFFTLHSLFDDTSDVFKLKETFNVTFDKVIFRILFNTFWKKVDEYQLNKLLGASEVIAAIDNSNATVQLKNKLRSKPVNGKQKLRLLTVAMLTQYVPLVDLKPYIPDSTYRRLRVDLDKLGITDASKPMTIPRPPLDYVDYRIHFDRYHSGISYS